MKILLKYVKEIFGHIIFLALVAVLVSLNIFHEPEITEILFVVALSLIFILGISILYNRLKQPYNHIFNSENDAQSYLMKRIRSYDSYENLRICGTSCTSIFSLFNTYVDAISNGKSISVFILNPEEENIIQYLSECEEDQGDVILKVKILFNNLKSQINDETRIKIENLLSTDVLYGKNLLTASVLLWFEAHEKANKHSHGKLTNGLNVFFYSHIPTLKAWVFGDKYLFIGSYGPLPGGVGINNPIYYIKGNNQQKREIIEDSKRTINFLMNNERTERISIEKLSSET